MRRDERAVTRPEDIFDILTRCDTIRLGMNGGGTPYVIPMTFGCELENGVITVYFHCAGAGRKWDILNSDPRVCVEADLYYRVAETAGGGITAYYESVIGTGSAELLTDRAERVRALKIIMMHYKKSGFPVESCIHFSSTELFRVRLTDVSGKHNL